MKTFFNLSLLPRTLAVMLTLGVAVVCAPVVSAKVFGTHSGGKCSVTDSAGVSASIGCGSGVSQATCNADGSCSIGALIGSVGGSDTGRSPAPKLSASPVEPDECVAYPERCRNRAAVATSPAISPEAQAERNKSGKLDPNPVATTDAKIPNNPPHSEPYCVCCAKGGPYTVTTASLPSYDFANACKMHNAGPVWTVIHTGIMACTCKGINGPAKDLKKYVK